MLPKTKKVCRNGKEAAYLFFLQSHVEHRQGGGNGLDALLAAFPVTQAVFLEDGIHHHQLGHLGMDGAELEGALGGSAPGEMGKCGCNRGLFCYNGWGSKETGVHGCCAGNGNLSGRLCLPDKFQFATFPRKDIITRKYCEATGF